MSWYGKKQTIMALSLVEAKYHALMEETKEIVWPRKLLNEINYIKIGLIVMFCDNVSSIKMAENQIFHAKTKYIECQYHIVGEKVMSNKISILYIPSIQQQADIFTKPLGRTKFEGL